MVSSQVNTGGSTHSTHFQVPLRAHALSGHTGDGCYGYCEAMVCRSAHHGTCKAGRSLGDGCRAVLTLSVEQHLSKLAKERQGERTDLKSNIVAPVPQCSVEDRKSREQAAKITGAAGRTVSQAIERRHLTPGQRAMLALDLMPLYEAEAKKRQGFRTDLVDESTEPLNFPADLQQGIPDVVPAQKVGRPRLSACALCGEAFAPSRRSDSRFCCNAHRQAAYRIRKEAS